MTEVQNITDPSGGRLDSFVDAAFAFAVTLLIIAGAQPVSGFDDLLAALGRIPAFAAGFALVAMYWTGHRSFGRLTPVRDGMTVLLSLAIVFTVLVYVFPLRFLAEAGAHFMSGGRLTGGGLITEVWQLQAAYAVYGVGAAVLAALYAALYHHAIRQSARFRLAEATLAQARESRRAWVAVALPSLLSAATAALPAVRDHPWLPGAVYWLIPFGIFVLPMMLRRSAIAGTSERETPST